MAPTLTVLAVVLSLLCHVQNSAAAQLGWTTQSLFSDPPAADQGTGGASLAEGRGLLQIAPAPQEVIDAALAATLNLLEINDGNMNPFVSYDVPCEVYQRVGGPYLLTNAFRGIPPTFVIRSCTFLDDAPILVAIQTNLCIPGCSPTVCACCDGTDRILPVSTVSPPPNGTCPAYQGTTCNPGCQGYYDAGGANPATNPASLHDLILIDLDAGTSVPIEFFLVRPTIGTLPKLPPNSFVSGPILFNYGPDVRAVGPFGIAGYYAYIPPSQLRRGGRYEIRRAPIAGDTVPHYYYQFSIADNTPCDPQSAASNQCFNAPGSASVCCAGQCPDVPLALPSCETVPTAAPASTDTPAPTTTSPSSTGSPAPNATSPTATGTPSPTTSAPSSTGSPAPTSTAAAGNCNPYGSLPNQCFNAAGTASVCCAGSCPNEPGPDPLCA